MITCYVFAAAGLALGFFLGSMLASIRDQGHEVYLIKRIRLLQRELENAQNCRECSVKLDGPFICIDCSPDATVLELVRPPEQT